MSVILIVTWKYFYRYDTDSIYRGNFNYCNESILKISIFLFRMPGADLELI